MGGLGVNVTETKLTIFAIVNLFLMQMQRRLAVFFTENVQLTLGLTGETFIPFGRDVPLNQLYVTGLFSPLNPIKSSVDYTSFLLF